MLKSTRADADHSFWVYPRKINFSMIAQAIFVSIGRLVLSTESIYRGEAVIHTQLLHPARKILLSYWELLSER